MVMNIVAKNSDGRSTSGLRKRSERSAVVFIGGLTFKATDAVRLPGAACSDRRERGRPQGYVALDRCALALPARIAISAPPSNRATKSSHPVLGTWQPLNSTGFRNPSGKKPNSINVLEGVPLRSRYDTEPKARLTLLGAWVGTHGSKIRCQLSVAPPLLSKQPTKS